MVVCVLLTLSDFCQSNKRLRRKLLATPLGHGSFEKSQKNYFFGAISA
jgi:hypothetical protein